VPHWECQTPQCSNCKEYPIPKEEAQEDGVTEDISFHVYEYKVSLRKDGKERRQLELVQKCTKISIACTIGLPLAMGGTIPPAICCIRSGTMSLTTLILCQIVLKYMI
jgi:hypothetical protein